jgi:nitrite reductase (NADH) small subunit
MQPCAAQSELPFQDWRRIARLHDLADDGTGRVVEIGAHRLAIFRIGETVRVIDDTCPHEGASLGDGIVSGGDVTCPWHAWHFDLETGASTDGLDECVRVHRARVDADGWVEVQLVEQLSRPA